MLCCVPFSDKREAREKEEKLTKERGYGLDDFKWLGTVKVTQRGKTVRQAVALKKPWKLPLAKGTPIGISTSPLSFLGVLQLSAVGKVVESQKKQSLILITKSFDDDVHNGCIRWESNTFLGVWKTEMDKEALEGYEKELETYLSEKKEKNREQRQRKAAANKKARLE